MPKIKRKPSLTLALTGGFGSGKSGALECFQRMGWVTVDCDEIARKLTSGGDKAAIIRIAGAFGSGVVTKGKLDRKKMAEVVFRDPAKRRRLEGILHPLILEEAARRLAASANPLRVVEIPLFYEAMAKRGNMSHNNRDNLSLTVDASLVVRTDKKIIFKRLRQRGWKPQEISLRLKSQMPLKEKCRKADFILDNNASRQNLFSQVKKIHQACQTIIKDYDQAGHPRSGSARKWLELGRA